MEKTGVAESMDSGANERADKTLVEREVMRRRTLCLISHPDAGKTTVTEKLLLFGGAIQFAGTVKARKSKKYATSDWMEIEKQRGISVTASAMRFRYHNFEINLLDTPGHQDFLEETYRSITAVDSALMVIDAAKGVEAQTLKLFQVCKKQKIPVIAFINKLDRESLSPFQLMEEIEKALEAQTTPITWPIGQGKNFKGVYDIFGQNFRLYKPKESENLEEHKVVFPLASEACQELLGKELHQELINDLALLEAAGTPFQREDYLAGKLIPVFFGSAIHNFGLLELLDHYLKICPDPLPRLAKTRWVEPTETDFSAFVFKIQANMDPNHRDRIAFLRVCSGRFEKNTKVFHTRLQRYLKIANPIFFMAEERELAEEAYAGDIIGFFDTGNFRIGDSLSLGEDLRFLDIPNFAPEYFALVKLLSPFKNKQLEKGLRQLSEEGSVQVFRKLDIPHFILGVVGRLQFEVVKFRLQHEYSVELEFQPLSYQCARWVTFPEAKLLQQFLYDNPSQVFLDTYDQHIVLANSLWEMEYLEKKYPQGLFFQAQDINEQTRS